MTEWRGTEKEADQLMALAIEHGPINCGDEAEDLVRRAMAHGVRVVRERQTGVAGRVPGNHLDELATAIERGEVDV